MNQHTQQQALEPAHPSQTDGGSPDRLSGPASTTTRTQEQIPPATRIAPDRNELAPGSRPGRTPASNKWMPPPADLPHPYWQQPPTS